MASKSPSLLPVLWWMKIEFSLLASMLLVLVSATLSLAVVIMGVSGSGKSTVGKALAEDLGCSFLEADDFHPKENKEKMSNGIPLSDEDRIPWLEALRNTTRKLLDSEQIVVLTCSALLKKYRDILRNADVNYNPGDYSDCKVKFVCLEAPMELIAERIERRSSEGNHFMPVTLLESQMDLLHIDESEGIIRIDADSNLENIIGSIKAHLKQKNRIINR